MSPQRRSVETFRTFLLALLLFSPAPAGASAVTLEGIVAAADGRPLAGARAELRPLAANRQAALLLLEGIAAPEPLAAADADERGRFSLAAPAAGLYSLTVAADGFVPVWRAPLPLTAALELPPVTLAADAGARVAVADPDGNPLADVWVFARAAAPRPSADGWQPAPRLRRTDRSGAVTLPRAPDERLDVSLFLPADAAVLESRGVTGASVVVPQRPRGRRLIEVRRPGGGPAAGVVVALGDLAWPLGVTGDDGRLELAGEPGEPVDLHLLGPGGGYLRAELDGASAVYVLPAPVAVAGRVLGQDEPLAGALVWLASDPGAFAASDARGRFALSAPRREGFLVRAEAAGYPPAAVHVDDASRRLTLRLGQDAALRGPASEKGFAVSGQVVDDAGDPVDGAVVEVATLRSEAPRHARATTADGGRFRIAGLAAGRYELGARKAGHARTDPPAELEIEDRPVEDLEVVLPAGTEVAGRVLGLEPGELTSLAVAAEQDGGPPYPGEVDGDGRYRVTDLGPGDWLLRATVDGGRREARARVVVEPGAREVRRDLELGRGVTLDGHVRFAGEPLAGARVRIRGQDPSAAREVVSDPEGAFRFQDLRPGAYLVSVTHAPERLVQHRRVFLDADDYVVFEIEAARVFGQVSAAADGRPLAATVVLQQLLDEGRRGSIYTASADAEGRFDLPRITAGRYELTVHRDGYGPAEDTLDVGANADLGPLHYALEATTGLTLQVRLASGEPPPLVTVSVADAAGRVVLNASRPVDAEGAVTFPTVPAGTWDVVVSAPGAAAAETRATVPGDPAALVLAAASRLRLRVPLLVEEDQLAVVSLTGADGEVFRGADEAGNAVREWRLAGGKVTVPGVPPGLWTVRVKADDGQVWESTVATAGEAEVAVVLR